MLIKQFQGTRRTKSFDCAFMADDKSSSGSVFLDFIANRKVYKRKLRMELREKGIELQL